MRESLWIWLVFLRKSVCKKALKLSDIVSKLAYSPQPRKIFKPQHNQTQNPYKFLMFCLLLFNRFQSVCLVHYSVTSEKVFEWAFEFFQSFDDSFLRMFKSPLPFLRRPLLGYQNFLMNLFYEKPRKMKKWKKKREF